jgi:hypothetical protein
MRRTSHTMSVLYALLAVGLFRCALISYQAAAWGYTAFFAAASIGAALAIVHVSWLLDEYRHLLHRSDADNRALARAHADEDAVRIAVAAASCCETWWATAGTDHDPATCTRKDQTT